MRFEELPRDQEISSHDGQWYHDFSFLGYPTKQLEGIYVPNQRCKEQYILPYLQLALAKSRRSHLDRPSVLEMFSADAYYACCAKAFLAGRVVAVDLDWHNLARGQFAAQRLGLDVQFRQMSVFDLPQEERFHVCVCCGGLYHVAEPWRVLEIAHTIATNFLVLQTVITLETDSPNYFVAPAPGWTHGCRFTAGKLLQWLSDTGWQIIDSSTNELEGNDRPCDRGSFYALCRRM